MLSCTGGRTCTNMCTQETNYTGLTMHVTLHWFCWYIEVRVLNLNITFFCLQESKKFTFTYPKQKGAHIQVYRILKRCHSFFSLFLHRCTHRRTKHIWPGCWPQRCKPRLWTNVLGVSCMIQFMSQLRKELKNHQVSTQDPGYWKPCYQTILSPLLEDQS